MIVDTSAVLAVFLDEADADKYAIAMPGTDVVKMSAANWFEAAMIVDRRHDTAVTTEFSRLERTFRVTIVDVTRQQIEWARMTWNRFGTGTGHPARLNFGDCLAYGLAKSAREPLLFKGEDFSQTDIEPALRD